MLEEKLEKGERIFYDGDLIEWQRGVFCGEEIIYGTTDFYKEEGNLSLRYARDEVKNIGRGLTKKTVTFYRKNGNKVTESTKIFRKETSLSETKTFYDKKENIIRTISINRYGMPYNTITYDKEGNVKDYGPTSKDFFGNNSPEKLEELVSGRLIQEDNNKLPNNEEIYMN